jgi:hypothetical protein
VNGNVNVTSAGNTSLVITGTGANIVGTLNATGNANVGNLGTTTLIATTGNITTINSGLVQSGNSNVTITANGNVTISAVGGERITATSTGANITGTLTATGNITGANIAATSFYIRSVGTGISAAGSTQATATVLTKEVNIVTTVAAGSGVELPTAVAGMIVTVRNSGANALLVYPDTGAAINSLATNAGFSQVANATLQFMAASTTQWYTIGATFA